MRELDAVNTNNFKEFLLITTHHLLGTPERLFQDEDGWKASSDIEFKDITDARLAKMISSVQFVSSTRCMIRGGSVYYVPIKDATGSTVNIRSIKAELKIFIKEFLDVFNKNGVTKRKLVTSMVAGGKCAQDLKDFCEKWGITTARAWSLLGLKECDYDFCKKTFGLAFYKLDEGAIVYTDRNKFVKMSDEEFSMELLNKQMLNNLQPVSSFE